MPKSIDELLKRVNYFDISFRFSFLGLDGSVVLGHTFDYYNVN